MWTATTSSAETYPFLSVRIGQIVDGLRVPHLADAEQLQRQESVLSHDHKVHEESGGRLDHADLTVGHRNQSARLSGFGVLRREAGGNDAIDLRNIN